MGFLSVCCVLKQPVKEESREAEEMLVYGPLLSMMVLLQSDVLVIEDLVGSERRLRIAHQGLKVTVGPLQ